MKALPNGCNQEHSGQKNRNAHVIVARLSRFCTSFHDVRSLLIQTKELLVLCVLVVGHEDRARRRLRVLERIRLQPSREGGPVFVSKATLEELRRLLTIQLRSEPTVESVAVVDPLLSCQGRKAFSSDSEPARLGVLLGNYH